MKEDPLDDNADGELMVSISNQEQQFEVVSMAHDESLLAETGQGSAGEGNENENEAETTTVDATTLAQVLYIHTCFTLPCYSTISWFNISLTSCF